jgi:hypothetical protein
LDARVKDRMKNNSNGGCKGNLLYPSPSLQEFGESSFRRFRSPSPGPGRSLQTRSSLVPYVGKGEQLEIMLGKSEQLEIMLVSLALARRWHNLLPFFTVAHFFTQLCKLFTGTATVVSLALTRRWHNLLPFFTVANFFTQLHLTCMCKLFTGTAAIPLLSCCYTAAILLLNCCYTAAKLLLYCC